MRDIYEDARGRWKDILLHFGFTIGQLDGTQQPCPICPGGVDRFHYSDRTGRGDYLCRKCGPGTGVALVMKKYGWDFKEAVARIREYLGVSYGPQRPQSAPKRDPLKRLKAIADGSLPLSGNDPASLYLKHRGITSPSPVLRYVPSLRYYFEKNEGDRRVEEFPAMVAPMLDREGKFVSIHVTYLTSEGSKAPVPCPKKTLTPLDSAGTIKGSAIRLYKPLEGLVAVTEGIENAHAVNALFDLPAWSLVNAVAMRQWIPPRDITQVPIYGDNDASYTGQAAAYELARRLVSMGVKAYVVLPHEVDVDWNDIQSRMPAVCRLKET